MQGPPFPETYRLGTQRRNLVASIPLRSFFFFFLSCGFCLFRHSFLPSQKHQQGVYSDRRAAYDQIPSGFRVSVEHQGYFQLNRVRSDRAPGSNQDPDGPRFRFGWMLRAMWDSAKQLVTGVATNRRCMAYSRTCRGSMNSAFGRRADNMDDSVRRRSLGHK